MIATNSRQAHPAQRVVVAHVEDRPGVLARVASLFRRRGFNIESLNVAPTKDYAVSRLTLVTNGSDETLEQIMKQLSKLVDVVDVRNMSGREHIIRELALFKLRLTTGTRAQLDEMVAEFGGSILTEHEGHFTIEITSSGPRIDGFLESAGRIAETDALVRSGAMAVSRGAPITWRG